ncbi:MAG: hypothetical protein ACRETB_04090 [Steroidobacteraceae bacterium]
MGATPALHPPRSARCAHGARLVRRVAEIGGLATLAATSTLALAGSGVTAPAIGSAVSGSGKAASAPAPGSAATAAVPPGAAAAPAASAHPLDLSLPPLRLVLTPQQLTALTAPSDDDGPMQDVTVSTPSYVAPVPTGQVRALTWALLHPLEAWRIFAPITGD